MTKTLETIIEAELAALRKDYPGFEDWYARESFEKRIHGLANRLLDAVEELVSEREDAEELSKTGYEEYCGAVERNAMRAEFLSRLASFRGKKEGV